MNLPKFHVSGLNEIAEEINGINSDLEKSFAGFEEAAKQRIKLAFKEIDSVAWDIENILKTNNTNEMKFPTNEYVYVLQLTPKGEVRIYKTTIIHNEVLIIWEPCPDASIKDVCENVSVKSSLDAHEVYNAATQLELHAKEGKTVLREFIFAVKSRESEILEKVSDFVDETDMIDDPE